MAPSADLGRRYRVLSAGDPAPWFHQRASSHPRYAFDTAAGRYVVLCFYGSAGNAGGRAAIDCVLERRSLFDDRTIAFFGVSIDPADEREGRVTESLPGIRYFWDFDGLVSRLYGSIPDDAKPNEQNVPVRRLWVVIDPTLRVTAVFPFADDGRHGQVLDYLARLPSPASYAGFEVQAPVLFLPNVFEPEFCRRLVALYEAHGGEESGFMQEVDGRTVGAYDYAHKRRKDCNITDEALIQETQHRIRRRIKPEILKVHQFEVTRMERYIVACYSAEDGGHFRSHRDNTTKGTAHRRFAVSINLNDDFAGGEICFPEYGLRTFKMPLGGACVFSCSLLHAVTPVTRGRRYAFLPFLYDDAAAGLREANNAYLGEGVGEYRAG